MTCIGTEYFSLNKFLLLVVGLWPYKQSKLIFLQFIFLLSVLISCILFQLTALLTIKHTSDLVIKIFSNVFFFIIYIIKYISFAVNIKNVKYLLTELQYIYNDLKDEYENVIIEKYSYNAKWYTVVLTILGACSVTILIVAQFWTNNIGNTLLKNVTQSHNLLITTEYFIDQEKHFYLIVLHTYVAISIGCIALIAIGTMLVAYLQHICGMLSISSYRIERVMRINMFQNNNLKNENLIFKGMIYAIDIHRQAMRLSKLMISKFEIMLFCLITVGVICLSLNLFRIFQIDMSEDNVNEFLFPLIFVISSILYMFIANYIGQDIMDHTNHIFVTAYNIQWYTAPLHIQNIILFLLQRRAKNFTLTVGGLFIGSLECFATLVKASVSYFTVIYSTQ